MGAPRKVLTRFDDYHAMLADRVRMDAYQRAIDAAVRPGDTVIDLGAGLGVLSFMALRAGAARVVAIEQGDAIELMRAVAAHNGLSERIEFIAANSRSVRLAAPADLLLSETLGSFGLEENTVEFTLDVRDRLLKPGGVLLPRAIAAYLAPAELPTAHARVSFWQDVAGFDFGPAADALAGRMRVCDVATGALMSTPQVFADVDLATASTGALRHKLLFAIERPGTLHGMAGWFDATLAEGIHIVTSPGDARTHWQQAFFPFRAPIDVIRGDYLEVTFQIAPRAETSDDSIVSYDYRCTQLASDPQAAPGAPSKASATGVGRNTPCPCGSGKKFKRCCGRA